MKSGLPGKNTLDVEVTNVGTHGFWLLVDDRELFLPYDQFPWFRDASIRQIAKITRSGPDSLRWPDLDVDLTIESIEHPDRYPLISRVAPRSATRSTRHPHVADRPVARPAGRRARTRG